MSMSTVHVCTYENLKTVKISLKWKWPVKLSTVSCQVKLQETARMKVTPPLAVAPLAHGDDIRWSPNRARAEVAVSFGPSGLGLKL